SAHCSRRRVNWPPAVPAREERVRTLLRSPAARACFPGGSRDCEGSGRSSWFGSQQRPYFSAPLPGLCQRPTHRIVLGNPWPGLPTRREPHSEFHDMIAGGAFALQGGGHVSTRVSPSTSTYG